MNSICHKVNGVIYFPKKKIPNKIDVINTLGVKERSYMGIVISRMYDYYFDGATDFREVYRKYYSKEFETLEEFIEEHYNITPDDARKYAAEGYCMKECSRRAIERNVETLNEDEKFKQLFSEAVGGINDEDPDGFYYE